MTDNRAPDARDTEEFLTSSERLDGVVETPDGRELPITVEVPTIGEIQAIEDAAADGDDQAQFDAMRDAIDGYLVDPDLDAYDIAISRVEPLFVGMMEAWTGSDEIGDALEDVQTEGNRSRSRTSQRRR